MRPSTYSEVSLSTSPQAGFSIWTDASGCRHFACVARVLEVIEDLRGIHRRKLYPARVARGAVAGRQANSDQKLSGMSASKSTSIGSISGINQLDQFLMDRMRPVGIQRSLVGELHHATQLVSLPARGDVHSNRGFQQTWDLALQLAYPGDDVLFLLVGHSRFPAKCEHVDVHCRRNPPEIYFLQPDDCTSKPDATEKPGPGQAAALDCAVACTITTVPDDYTPQRVVCLQPSTTVILAAIGRLDRVVACTKYCVGCLSRS